MPMCVYLNYMLKFRMKKQQTNKQTNWNELIESQVISIGNTRGDQII